MKTNKYYLINNKMSSVLYICSVVFIYKFSMKYTENALSSLIFTLGYSHIVTTRGNVLYLFLLLYFVQVFYTVCM